jgi:hypothetical protein
MKQLTQYNLHLRYQQYNSVEDPNCKVCKADRRDWRLSGSVLRSYWTVWGQYNNLEGRRYLK